MLALGEPRYEPFRYQPLRHDIVTSSFDSHRTSRGYPWGTPTEQDTLDDAAGDATFFVRDPAQMMALGSSSARERLRYGSLYRRKAW
jgi:hypothetical protein